jgi:serine/threonine protein phosphatase PrpC
VWSEVSDDEIVAATWIGSPEDACRHVIDLQLGRASLDNATVLVVNVVSVDPGAPESEWWITNPMGRIVSRRHQKRVNR